MTNISRGKNECDTCMNNMEPGSLTMYGCILDYINTKSTGGVDELRDAAMKACIVNQEGNCPMYSEMKNESVLTGGLVDHRVLVVEDDYSV